jgi:hypothetical protein
MLNGSSVPADDFRSMVGFFNLQKMEPDRK